MARAQKKTADWGGRADHPLPGPPAALSTKAVGDAAEDRALAHLRAAGLRLLARNYRTPGRGGGEIDLILREPDGTVVFVEVRQRASRKYGGAAASVGPVKQARVVRAARSYLMRMPRLPACRFDVVALDAGEIAWLRGAFEAG